MLRDAEGRASMVSLLRLVPVPILVALKISEPPATPTAVTVASVVTSPVSWALTVLAEFRPRNTLSSVLVPAPALVMVISYGPPTRRPRAL